MSAPSHNRRRRGDRSGGGHDGPDERWLLTYSDMITLLMALFIVMWSISAVNKSKFDELKQSLHQAFTHEKVLDGGRSVLESDGADRSSAQPIVPNDPVAQRVAQLDRAFADAAERADVENLRRVQRQIESYAREHGFSGQIRTSLDERGLVVRMLTDKVLFDTGKAVVEPEGMPLLHEIAGLLRGPKITNPVRVEGNTDTVPIHTAQFRSNWELSTARATAVLQVLLHGGVLPTRLSAAGYADQHPAASNGSAAGRKLNRRVEIVVLRHAFARQEGIE